MQLVIFCKGTFASRKIANHTWSLRYTPVAINTPVAGLQGQLM